MARYFTGIEGTVTANGTDLCVTGWDATVEAEEIEVTHTCTGGVRAYINGPTTLSGNVNANWDADSNPLLAPPAIVAGTEVALKLYLESSAKGAANEIDVPAARINTINFTNAVDAVTNYNFAWRANGAFTLPTGTF